LPAKKKVSKPDAQTELLQQILAELKQMNANLAFVAECMRQPPPEGGSEELDEYE
jgi:hypothetical protein